MARFFMYLFAVPGVVALGNWVFAHTVFGDDLAGPSARAAASPDMLYTGLVLTAIGLVIALLLGFGFGSKPAIKKD